MILTILIIFPVALLITLSRLFFRKKIRKLFVYLKTQEIYLTEFLECSENQIQNTLEEKGYSDFEIICYSPDQSHHIIPKTNLLAPSLSDISAILMGLVSILTIGIMLQGLKIMTMATDITIFILLAYTLMYVLNYLYIGKENQLIQWEGDDLAHKTKILNLNEIKNTNQRQIYKAIKIIPKKHYIKTNKPYSDLKGE